MKLQGKPALITGAGSGIGKRPLGRDLEVLLHSETTFLYEPLYPAAHDSGPSLILAGGKQPAILVALVPRLGVGEDTPLLHYFLFQGLSE